MLGEFIDDYSISVVDVFAMPQSGTGVSVEAVDPVFQTKMLDMLKQVGTSDRQTADGGLGARRGGERRTMRGQSAGRGTICSRKTRQAPKPLAGSRDALLTEILFALLFVMLCPLSSSCVIRPHFPRLSISPFCLCPTLLRRPPLPH